MKRWSDPRLKVSFLFGPVQQAVVAYLVNELYAQHSSKSDCDARMRRLCNDLDGGYTSEKAASFRAAYDKMMSTVTVDDDDEWDEKIALRFAFFAVLQEYS